jgi:hypothetical protein
MGIRQRQPARELRRLREQAGYSLEVGAGRLAFSIRLSLRLGATVIRSGDHGPCEGVETRVRRHRP